MFWWVSACHVPDFDLLMTGMSSDSWWVLDEYASQLFVPYMLSQFQKASCVDLVWDRYIQKTLKSTTRAKRGKGIGRRVVSGTPIPGNWEDFLCVDSNKADLFHFLSLTLINSFTCNLREKQLVVTDDVSTYY